MGATRLAQYVSLPETQRELTRLALEYGVAQQPELFDGIISQYLSGSLRSSQIPISLIEACGLPDEDALKLGAEITSLFYEVEDMIGSEKIPTLGIAAYLKSRKIQENRLDAILSDIKKRSGISISEDVLDRRFRTIVISWIRQVRDDIQTRQTALRETRVGGLGLTEEVANRFLDTLKAVRDEQARQGTDLVRVVNEYVRGQETVPALAQDVEIDVKGRVKSEQENRSVKISLPISSAPSTNPVTTRIEKTEQLIESHAEISAPKRVALIPTPVASGQKSNVNSQTSSTLPSLVHSMVENAVKNMPRELKQENVNRQSSIVNRTERSVTSFPNLPTDDHQSTIDARPSTSATSQPSIRRPVTESLRPKMADVRPPQKLYGPIEELGALSVSDFRRLSADPEEAVRKLEHKLGLLEDESLTRRAEGIRALQTSPLYRAYAQRMFAAVGGGTTPGDLTDAELRAILKLNKTLKK